MTYKESLTMAMTRLGQDPATVFVGYNVRYGSLANGTLANVPISQRIETPVAENLMGGMAIGLSLGGLKPVVYFERFDFILNAMDAIVNHLDKMGLMSQGQFNPKVIIRVLVGAKNMPLFTGPTHTQDFSDAFRHLVSFPVIQLKGSGPSPAETYQWASEMSSSSMIIEYRELYSNEVTD
jgi:pyruvate/2-oxoglutarate/acetoin dehydrogenase E1 component